MTRESCSEVGQEPRKSEEWENSAKVPPCECLFRMHHRIPHGTLLSFSLPALFSPFFSCISSSSFSFAVVCLHGFLSSGLILLMLPVRIFPKLCLLLCSVDKSPWPFHCIWNFVISPCKLFKSWIFCYLSVFPTLGMGKTWLKLWEIFTRRPIRALFCMWILSNVPYENSPHLVGMDRTFLCWCSWAPDYSATTSPPPQMP